jgi:hypothetical protein
MEKDFPQLMCGIKNELSTEKTSQEEINLCGKNLQHEYNVNSN